MPVSSIESGLNILASESNVPLSTEDDQDFFTENDLNTNTTRVNFDTNFKRIYLQDFLHDRFKLGTVGESYVKFLNPFYGSVDDGPLTSVGENQYNFTYSTATDSIGEYITNVVIEVEFTSTNYFTYNGPNSPLTTKVLFMDNQQLLIQIPEGSLQGLAIYTNDPRQTTRAIPLPFIAEDFTDQTPQDFGDDVNYLRTFNTSKQFVQYRLTPPRMFGVKYDNTSVYSSGSQIYFDLGQNSGGYNIGDKTKASNGNFFFATTNVTSGITPVNQTSDVWQQVEIPARFRDYLANSVSSDFLKSEGRAEEAVVLEQLAESAIQQQIDVLIRQQAQNQRLNMAYTY
jgi:hypothetical protein